MKKRVLIITYYWPPSGGAGVQRWLKFSKYLPDFDWEPVIYTPENPEVPVDDPSLLEDVRPGLEVIKRPIVEPYSAYKKFIGQKKGERVNAAFLSENKRPGFKEKLSVWIRGNFFIPDSRRFWVRPSVRFLKKYLEAHPVDAIVSTGPPHSMHLIALALKKKLNIPWLADFRDPWTNIDFYPDLNLTPLADAKHRKLERKVITSCDEMVVVSRQMKTEFEELDGKNIHVITNGFDDADVSKETPETDEKFSIIHAGSLPPNRNPRILWKVLQELVTAIPELADSLQIKLVGKVDVSVLEDIRNHQLEPYLELVEYVPHDTVMKMLQQAQVLLLAINQTPNAKGILTGKFFEYLAACRPVLTIGPTDGDVANILKEVQAGLISGFDDEEGLKKNILEFFNRFREGNLSVNSEGIHQYSRKNLTSTLAEHLNKISS
ncbi:glycosyltransferase [Prolixibacter denitrificans]|jgi:glycosyltransferase involved in cell wall biosynthesis|uniref:Glycosyl transferase family 1 n=1 Tax=Prolixibacter denitrificans TaxID=1541063 RepID=A0A2P8CL88_9BACT|nr:glycosyltransferase [Prolixibacter denitrificans]PSK85745.1 glycosyltransferase involved in cell wall biosynthesis [Prolixibacter denitrificans]GET20364.1 glycosyl transferase family 1 [Prolixibacter denitrificans]